MLNSFRQSKLLRIKDKLLVSHILLLEFQGIQIVFLCKKKIVINFKSHKTWIIQIWHAHSTKWYLFKWLWGQLNKIYCDLECDLYSKYRLPDLVAVRGTSVSHTCSFKNIAVLLIHVVHCNHLPYNTCSIIIYFSSRTPSHRELASPRSA